MFKAVCGVLIYTDVLKIIYNMLTPTSVVGNYMEYVHFGVYERAAAFIYAWPYPVRIEDGLSR